MAKRNSRTAPDRLLRTSKGFLKLHLCLLFTLGLSISTASASGPNHGVGDKVKVGQHVAADQRVSMNEIDHSAWHAILQKYVDADGLVDYQALKASNQDLQSLHHYLSTLSHASTSAEATEAAKLAYWINAYNAVTVFGILREYPTTTIKNHTSKLGGYNIWHDLLLIVDDQQVSLDHIEHQILRTMGEPRIHFAIVCASISCPRLLNEAYTAENLNEKLNENATHFFAKTANFQHVNGRFKMSAIMKWFAKDFGDDQATRLRTIAPFLPTDSAQTAATNNSVRVSYLSYDWNLNEQKN